MSRGPGTDGGETPSRSRPIRVVIADDHSLYRQGLRAVVGLDQGIEVVGCAGSGTEAVAVCARQRPDVVLLDVRMPGMSGVEACRAIRDLLPRVRILMLTASDDEDDLFEAIRAGANGYLLKDVPGEEVGEALHRVHEGLAVIPPVMAARLLQEFSRLEPPAAVEEPTELQVLTHREVEVLRLLALGMGNRAIAKELFVSENTAKNHVSRILEKLHLHSRTEAAVFAHQRRLMEKNG